MKRTLISIAAALLCLTYAQAKVELPNIIADNMVLQHSTDVALWGKARPSAKVTIIPSWKGAQKVTVQSDKEGRWEAKLPTAAPGGPYEITFSDGEKLTLTNILLGEVWYASGQSNMEMPMKGYGNQPAEGAMDYIVQAREDRPIRLCNVTRTSRTSVQPECDVKWMLHNGRNVADISATAYFFAEYLQKCLDVPVGIIVASWGGSTIQAWMDREIIARDFPEFDLSHLDKEETPKQGQHQLPSLLYNGMVAPLFPYTVAGMIWYQGCSNMSNPDQYRKLQPAYVKMMRDAFRCGDIPFYYVQIAPFNFGGLEKRNAAFLREAQLKNLEDIPNSGMAVTMDAGDWYCIHPAKKQQVGHRLAYMALADKYGFEGFEAHTPVYESMTVEKGAVQLKFRNTVMGLAPLGWDLDGFEVAGEDRVFYPAKGRINRGFYVKVTCDKVKNPVAVRYCFRNGSSATLFNNFGIPVSPFRTDDWDE